MSTSPDRPPRDPEDFPSEDSGLPELEREYARTVEEVLGAARAEAQAAGRQYRLIHRMWTLQEQAHVERCAAQAAWSRDRARRLGRTVRGPEKRTVQDVAEEVGSALRLPAITAEQRVEYSIVLAESLPRVLTALEAGEIGLRQAELIVETWRDLAGDGLSRPSEECAPLEAVQLLADELLERAPFSTVAQLRAVIRKRRKALLRETEEARHRVALRDRRVWVEPREDGMAALCALLDAATAHAIQNRLGSIAERVDPERSTPELPGPELGAEGPDRRTPQQVRADVLAALLLDGEPTAMPEHLRGIRGHVSVTVPVLALLEQAGIPWPADLPRTVSCPELAGYGPIPVSMAERIAARAGSWSRVLTHPVTGVVLEHDRTTYAVPADLKRRLRMRDGTCRFPGCRRTAARCDLDHTVAWADGGPTAADNLAHLCRRHHLLKHRDGPLGSWHVRHRDPKRQEGVLEWTSPAGRVHVTYPQEHHHPVLDPLRIPDALPPHAPPPQDVPTPDDLPSFDDSPPFDDPPPF